MQSYLQYLKESIGNEFASGFKEEVTSTNTMFPLRLLRSLCLLEEFRGSGLSRHTCRASGTQQRYLQLPVKKGES